MPYRCRNLKLASFYLLAKIITPAMDADNEPEMREHRSKNEDKPLESTLVTVLASARPSSWFKPGKVAALFASTIKKNRFEKLSMRPFGITGVIFASKVVSFVRRLKTSMPKTHRANALCSKRSPSIRAVSRGPGRPWPAISSTADRLT